MKVIDLLNKIANGEEAPKKIKVGELEFEKYIESPTIDYRLEKGNTFLFQEYVHIFGEISLNDEIEIIEEDKEMEKSIKPFKEYWEDVNIVGCDLEEAQEVYLDRLSKIVIELANAVNELKKDK